MTINSNTYHVPPHKKLNLSEWPTVAPALTKSKKHYQKLLEEHVKRSQRSCSNFTTHPTGMRF
jgi:hypothetical protein